MKIKLSKSQWEEMGRKAGWTGTPKESSIAAIGRGIISNSNFSDYLLDIWEDAVSESTEDIQKNGKDTTIQHFKDTIYEMFKEWLKILEGIEQAVKQDKQWKEDMS